MGDDEETMFLSLRQEDFPLLVLIMDKDQRVGRTLFVSSPGAVAVNDMPESGRPWSIKIARAREDYQA